MLTDIWGGVLAFCSVEHFNHNGRCTFIKAAMKRRKEAQAKAAGSESDGLAASDQGREQPKNNDAAASGHESDEQVDVSSTARKGKQRQARTGARGKSKAAASKAKKGAKGAPRSNEDESDSNSQDKA